MIDRRRLLGGILGLRAAAVAGTLSSTAPQTYEEAVRATRAPLRATPRDRELVRFATLAANSHNTQPWTFTMAGKKITIAPDFARRCPVVDPDNHHLFVGLGCAAENLVVAAPAIGLTATPVFDGERVVIDLEPAPSERSALVEAIPARQCTGAKFDGKPLAFDVLRLLVLVASPAHRRSS